MTDNFDRSKLPHLYQEVFAKNPAGVVVLDDLRARFVDHDDPSPTKLDALQLAFAAGQRAVIRHIMLRRDQLAREADTEQ